MCRWGVECLHKYPLKHVTPINYVDPTGHIAWWIGAAVGGGVFDTLWYVGDGLINKKKITWAGAGKAAVTGALTGVTLGAVGKGAKVAVKAVNTTKVASKAVKSTEIANKVVEPIRFANNAVTPTKIANKVVKPTKIANKVVAPKKSATIAKKVEKAVSKEATGSAPKCFVAGTLIAVEEGRQPIEEIKVGQLVYSENPETGEKGFKKVLQTFVRETEVLIHIHVDGQKIATTAEHPFYVPEKGWKNAGDLRVRDILITVNGEYKVVERIRRELLETPIKVYNFEVEDFHTYYVSDSSILVHNANYGFNSNQQSVINKIKANGKSKPLSMSDANKLVEQGKKNGLNVHIDMGHPEKTGVSKGPHLHTGFNNWHIPIKK